VNRQELVEALVEWRGEVKSLAATLAEFDFDCETPLATLRLSNIADTLKRFIGGNVSANDVEIWAEAVEGRDDIDYAKDQEELISESLFALSTPSANGPLTKFSAQEMLGRLADSI
jgi:hypothetical protein